MSSKVWFITGTSRGFGREWAKAALERGDQVAATARDIASLDDLVATYGDAIMPIALDVTDRDADFAAVAAAHERFGRLDVVVNNAGYGHFGFVEEVTEQEAQGADRDESVWRAVDHPGRAAVSARARQWAHHSGVLDRRYFRISHRRAVSRLEMGVGRVLAGPQPGSVDIRYPRDTD